MKKCMKCGGNIMSNGGKVAPLQKRKTGGASESKGCPPGYYWSVQGCQKKGPGYKGPLSSPGAKIGVGIPVLGMVATGIKAGVDAIKKGNQVRKEAKTLRNANPGMSRKESIKTVKNNKEASLAKEKKGGSVKSKKK